MNSTAIRRFYRLCLASLIAVYFLILVGGVVRTTGAGMGCPDWPTCFGSIVPPTSVTELPSDYKEQYAAYREKKNVKFARYLDALGLKETANKLRNDPAILQEADFNPVKTWTEYVNRLVGVVIGLFLIALFVASLPLRKTHPYIFYGSGLALVLVIFQGWFGSIVVSSNLTTWTVTIHMFLALLLVANLLWLLAKAGGEPLAVKGMTRVWIIVALLVSLVQVFLGTEVRSALDTMVGRLDRSEWIGAAGRDFIVHRSFSWLVLLIQIRIWLLGRKTSHEKALSWVPFMLILGSLLSGVAMAWLDVPAALQPLHLLLALLVCGWFIWLIFRSNLTTSKVL